MSDVLGLLVTALTAVVLLCTLVGLAVKYALLPWLREQIVNPLAETRHQVTVNAHTSDNPTVLDRIDSLSDQVAAMDDAFSKHIAESGPGRHERKRP